MVGNATPAGPKVAKERLTVMLCASMSGQKRQPQVIGQSKRPRGFPKNASDLPISWDFSTNVWQTKETMTKWLRNWDRELRIEGSNICLLMDNCRVHPTHEEIGLTNI